MRPLRSRSRAVDSGRVAPWDRRGVHDRSGRLAVEQKLVEDARKLLDRAEVKLHVEAVLAGDPQALLDLGNVGGQFGDLRELAHGRFDPDDRGERVAERPWVDFGAVAGDYPSLLEAAHALGHRRRGEANAAPQLRKGNSAVFGQFSDDLSVCGVKHYDFHR